MFQIPSRTVTLRFEGDYQGAEVRLRYNVSLAWYLQVQDMLLNKETKASDLFREFAGRVLVSWNLEDETGPVPANGDGMVRIPHELAWAIIAEWTAARASVPAPLAKPLLDGGMSAEAPVKSGS